MTDTPEKGFVLNAKTISLLTGCAALFGVFWQGIGWAKDLSSMDDKLNTRITRVEEWKVERDRSRELFLQKQEARDEKISTQLTELKVSLKALETAISKRGVN